MHIAIATCRQLPEPDPDQAPLLAALARAGHTATMLPWNPEDPAEVDAEVLRRFDLCVLRSTWDYYLDLPGFLAFIDRAAAHTTLLNPADVVRVNSHKRYLLQLRAAGVPTVPTALVERGELTSLEACLEELGAEGDVVIKPAVSAASFSTRRFRVQEKVEAQAFLTALSSQRDVLVQPYIEGVETRGERACVVIDGRLTHAVRKSPRLESDDEHVSDALTPTPAEEALAVAALGWTGAADRLLYARVDVVPDDAGDPMVAELELIEPSLFLAQHPPALDRLVDAICQRGG